MTHREDVERILKDESLTNFGKIQNVIELECKEEREYDKNDLSAQYGLTYWDEKKAGKEQPTATDFEISEDENLLEVLNIDYEKNIVKFRFDVFSLINIDEDYGYEDEEIKKSIIVSLDYNKISNVSILEREKEMKRKDTRYKIEDTLFEDIANAMYNKYMDFIEIIEILDIIDKK